jgi:hypothetical protein
MPGGGQERRGSHLPQSREVRLRWLRDVASQPVQLRDAVTQHLLLDDVRRSPGSEDRGDYPSDVEVEQHEVSAMVLGLVYRRRKRFGTVCCPQRPQALRLRQPVEVHGGG